MQTALDTMPYKESLYKEDMITAFCDRVTASVTGERSCRIDGPAYELRLVVRSLPNGAVLHFWTGLACTSV